MEEILLFYLIFGFYTKFSIDWY